MFFRNLRDRPINFEIPGFESVPLINCSLAATRHARDGQCTVMGSALYSCPGKDIRSSRMKVKMPRLRMADFHVSDRIPNSK